MPKTKGLTEKQKKFLVNKAEGMSSQKAALEAGYAPGVAKNANSQILDKAGVKERWLDILEKHGISEDLAAKKIKEGLEAYRLSTSLTEPDKVVPDFATRHKYLETTLEQLGRKAKDSTPPMQIAFFNNITVEKEEFGI